MLNKKFYSFFSRRADINATVRHIVTVNTILDVCGYKKNLADIISSLMQEEQLDTFQVKSIISAILCDKWNYNVYPINLSTTPKNADMIVENISTWKGVDVVFTYEAPELGFIAMNPKNPASKELFKLFRKNELFTIYAGYQGRGKLSNDIFMTMIDAINNMFKGEEGVVSKAILDGSFVYKEIPVSMNKKKNLGNDNLCVSFPNQAYKMSKVMSIKIDVPIFNEMNFLAWKRIISDYTTKHQTANIYIFYKGELVSNLEKLVSYEVLKKGSVLQIAVKDFVIQDVQRLFKYLEEGASERFEVFLSDSPDMKGNLF